MLEWIDKHLDALVTLLARSVHIESLAEEQGGKSPQQRFGVSRKSMVGTTRSNLFGDCGGCQGFQRTTMSLETRISYSIDLEGTTFSRFTLPLTALTKYVRVKSDKYVES